jgi:hypothetical protein
MRTAQLRLWRASTAGAADGFRRRQHRQQKSNQKEAFESDGVRRSAREREIAAGLW